MELHLKIIGIILIVLALIHIVFPRFFKWKQELNSLSIMNRQLMLVHTFFIALMVLLNGLLCLSSAPELINTNLGKKISLGLGHVLDHTIIHPVLWLLACRLEGQSI